MSNNLNTYYAKRNFSITPEPRGRIGKNNKNDQLRFVIQKHAARRLHYDFRLELDGTLKSWAVPKVPSMDPQLKRLAVQVEDHPLDYIDFAGTIPAHQYGAGTVEIWDAGLWQSLDPDPSEAYRKGKMKFELFGEKLHGKWVLVRTGSKASQSQIHWLLIKEQEIDALPSGESSTAIAAAIPEAISPQLATLVDTIPTQGEWLYETKFDGYRILVRIDGENIRLFTRSGQDWTHKLIRQRDALAKLKLKNAWLDGELVALDDKDISSFQALQNAFDAKKSENLVLYVFDVLFLNDYDLRLTPLKARRSLLEELATRFKPGGLLRYSQLLTDPPDKLLKGACRTGHEGIIGKRADSTYEGKRSPSWIKLKCHQRQEFVIIGYTEPQGSRAFFGALLLAVHDKTGTLRYAGKVGTGFNQKNLSQIHKRLKAIAQPKTALAEKPTGTGPGKVYWVKPQLVAEVHFAQWTDAGIIRQGVFQGLRDDKPQAQIHEEAPMSISTLEAKHSRRDTKKDASQIEGVSISHAERIIDNESGVSKLDLAQYYAHIAPYILPFLKNRPVYLLRAPDGVEGEKFFQKHNTQLSIPHLRLLDRSLDPEHEPLMVIDSASALVGAVQMGSIEFHTCNARADKIDRPDCMVFDLDPDPKLPWDKVIEATELTKVLLDELGLKSFVKTSGGKGMHIYVPLTRRHSWDDLADFSQAVSTHLARAMPKRFSAKMGAQNRIGKVFVDSLRNRRHASTAIAYSARARPGMAVSVPITWNELTKIEGATQWTIETLPERLESLKTDPWQEYFATQQSLTRAMRERLNG